MDERAVSYINHSQDPLMCLPLHKLVPLHSKTARWYWRREMLPSKSQPRSKRRNGRNPISGQHRGGISLPAYACDNYQPSHSPHNTRYLRFCLGLLSNDFLSFPAIFSDLHRHPIMLGIFGLSDLLTKVLSFHSLLTRHKPIILPTSINFSY